MALGAACKQKINVNKKSEKLYLTGHLERLFYMGGWAGCVFPADCTEDDSASLRSPSRLKRERFYLFRGRKTSKSSKKTLDKLRA